jgi:CBS domain-containing membrane protein
MLTVSEIMTREPYTMGPDDTLETARQMMAEHHIRHIPVVNKDGSLMGLVSQRDVLAAEDSTVLNAAGDKSPQRYVAVSSIMTTPVQTTEENSSLRGTAMFLQQHKLGCLPVLDKGKLTGIITDTDFVGVAINLMEQLEDAEPQETQFEDE